MNIELRRLGKYELRERLARGGQGEVWKAFDTQLRRYVAIKQLNAELQPDPDFATRFEREARFIASLRHPNIVQIHDFQLIRSPGSNTTTVYMVMDYIEGPTLADFIRNTSRKMLFPSAADIVYIFTGISLALDYAHGKGMIHRDIKPPNIILDRRASRKTPIGEPILTDFGIARLQGGSADTTVWLGTPHYVSPEQAQGLVGDKESDLYSLGIILYEMTTGVTPFRGESLLAILMQHYQELPTPPALINPDIPPALSEVILRSIAKDPGARFHSAVAMTIAIAESLNVAVPADLVKPSDTVGIKGEIFGSDLPTLLTTSADGSSESSYLPDPAVGKPASIASLPSQVSPPVLLPPLSPQQPIRRRRTLLIVLLTLLALVVVGSGLFVTFSILHRTNTTVQPNAVVGQVRFLSVPPAPQNSINEAEVTVQSVSPAAAGKVYYAWLQISDENIPAVHWPLTLQNGSLSSSYSDTNLLANTPYLFLITAETAGTNPVVASTASGARLYYALLPTIIQNMATFPIRTCPQDNTCY